MVTEATANQLIRELIATDPTLGEFSINASGTINRNPNFTPLVVLDVTSPVHQTALSTLATAFSGFPVWIKGLTTSPSGRTVNAADKHFAYLDATADDKYTIVPTQADRDFTNDAQDKKIAALQQGVTNQTPYPWQVTNPSIALPTAVALYEEYGVEKATLVAASKEYATFKIQAYQDSAEGKDEVGKIVTWNVPAYTDMGDNAVAAATQDVFNGQYVYVTFRTSDDSLAKIYFDKNTDVTKASKTAGNYGAVRLIDVNGTPVEGDLVDWLQSKGYIDDAALVTLRSILTVLGNSSAVDITAADYDTDSADSMAGAVGTALQQLRQFTIDRIQDTATTGTDITWSVSKIVQELSAQKTSLEQYADDAATQALDDAKEYTDEQISQTNARIIAGIGGLPFEVRLLIASNSANGRVELPGGLRLLTTEKTYTYNPAALSEGAIGYNGNLLDGDNTTQFADNEIKDFIAKVLVEAEVTDGSDFPHIAFAGINYTTGTYVLKFALENVKMDFTVFPYKIEVSDGSGQRINATRTGLEAAGAGVAVANIKQITFTPATADATGFRNALQAALDNSDAVKRFLGEKVLAHAADNGTVTLLYANKDAVFELGN